MRKVDTLGPVRDVATFGSLNDEWSKRDGDRSTSGEKMFKLVIGRSNICNLPSSHRAGGHRVVVKDQNL